MRLSILAAALAASTLPVTSAVAQNGPVLSPAEAIRAVEGSSLARKTGRFGFTVARAEMVGPRLFLNSMADYRDPANLSISIERSALPGLRQRYGSNLPQAFLGRQVIVDEVVRRQAIATRGSNPHRTTIAYFQTRIAVGRAAQISIAQ